MNNHSHCEHIIACLKCNELLTLPNGTISETNTKVTYPGQNCVNFLYWGESYFANLLSVFQPTRDTYPSLPSLLSFTPTNEHQRKVINNKNRHVPYNIPSNFARNENKKPISFDLIFIEDIDDKRPIPKKPEIVKHCFEIDSREEIKKSVEKIFSKLKDKDWEFLRCESFKLIPANIPWTIGELERISGSRKKLYIGYKKRPYS
ncbi:hypothetical protein RhiirC2_847629 [Rhizophagus irregularis]|uniref:Uncharacterized protein n=1 Tax=Rhizophagus irregularis TaxID=588596 RepID=A0A2N1NHW0_9GLOM|nr:hypothetical protein RhiirC2_847629 [Rhizophagus irregularis]